MTPDELAKIEDRASLIAAVTADERAVVKRIHNRPARLIVAVLLDDNRALVAALRAAQEREEVLRGRYEIKDYYTGSGEEGEPTVHIWQVYHYTPMMMGNPLNKRGFKTREEAQAALDAALGAKEGE